MSDPAVPLPLPERFVVGTLAALKEAIGERRAAGADVVLDATAVRSVDTAALQFLLVCRATRAAADDGPLLVGMNEVLESTLADIGASGLITR